MRKAYSENGKGALEDPREVDVCWMAGVGRVVFVWRLLPIFRSLLSATRPTTFCDLQLSVVCAVVYKPNW